MEVETMLVSAVTGLSGAIVFLYRLQTNQHQSALKKLEQCEIKHDESNNKIVELSRQVGKLTGIKETQEKIDKKLEKLINDKL